MTLSSNVCDPNGMLGLADQKIDYEELSEVDEVSEISADEFEIVWSAYLDSRRSIWDQVRQDYPLGTKIVGVVKIFFPQGAVFVGYDELFQWLELSDLIVIAKRE